MTGVQTCALPISMFDLRDWPDPDAMIAELKEMGIELMVSFWPTVDNRTESYREMKENGWLVHTERGLPINMDFLGNTTFFDATHPGAREYVWNKAKRNYYDKGVKLFWLDEAEPEFGVYDYDNYRYYAGPVLSNNHSSWTIVLTIIVVGPLCCQGP